MNNRKNGMKIAFVDIGELGWSLYLSAHLRWLKKNTNYSVAIITLSDRKCLYRNLVDLNLDVPDDFHERFNDAQNCFGLGWPFRTDLKKYFQAALPLGYSIPENFNFDLDSSFLINRLIYKPYDYSKKLTGKKKILIFPRHRKQSPYSSRNLPKSFYIELINVLCDKFPNYEIKIIGICSGTYDIKEIRRNNYINGVKDDSDLQNMIDECQLAIVAIGGSSSLPKISLLQKVPTFIIGHEKKRSIENENWMKTRVGFYEIYRDAYGKFNFKDNKNCVDKILDFIEEEIK